MAQLDGQTLFYIMEKSIHGGHGNWVPWDQQPLYIQDHYNAAATTLLAHIHGLQLFQLPASATPAPSPWVPGGNIVFTHGVTPPPPPPQPSAPVPHTTTAPPHMFNYITPPSMPTPSSPPPSDLPPSIAAVADTIREKYNKGVKEDDLLRTYAYLSYDDLKKIIGKS